MNEPKDITSYQTTEPNLEPAPEKHPAKGIVTFIVEFFQTALKVVIIVAVLRVFIIQPFYVRGESMVPNFEEGEYLVVEKISYRVVKPKRGDVIVFQFPGQPLPCGPFAGHECVNFIKRIIGLPGERVEVREGQVFVYNKEHPQGVQVKEPYLPPDVVTGGADSKTLGENEFYVLGDNRSPGGSSDSRDWGVVHKSRIIGRVWVTVFPVTELGIKGTVTYPGI